MSKQKLMTVYGTGKGRMEKNKAYAVSEIQGKKLITKGVASIKPNKKDVS